MKRFFASSLKVKIGVAILSLVLFNIFAVSIGVAFFRDKFHFLANKSEKVVMSDLLFIEGGVVFAVGALVASGASNLRMETPSSLYADPDGHAKFLRESRRKQFSFGIVLMIVGVCLIGLSIAVSLI